MYIEKIKLKNFRCFGDPEVEINLDSDLTTFVGINGSGKTAVMQALMRMFGVTKNQREVTLQDFYRPYNEIKKPKEREFSIEVLLTFPELSVDSPQDTACIPEFFNQMTIDDSGILKCRFVFTAKWIDDNSLDGSIETKFFAITTLEDTYDENDLKIISSLDRGKIQLIYIPAIRDGSSQVSQFLKGRLWKAIKWTDEFKDTLKEKSEELNEKFKQEEPVKQISNTLKKRWNALHTGGTDTKPILQTIDNNFEEFIKKIDLVFYPDEFENSRKLEDLSDGQRSLLHLSMIASTIDLENAIKKEESPCYNCDEIDSPSLTILAIEEPENNLAPFYLSRIINQIKEITKLTQLQAVISSHSASILSRIEPQKVRHFRLRKETKTAIVKEIQLPKGLEEETKFIQEAVMAYPELYFAKVVILGEGASEEIVLPKIAEAMDIHIDRSFIAIVPLGGRHVNHMWKLLNDLEIPYVTLLDLDIGRFGGDWGRIKYICEQLMLNGLPLEMLTSTKISKEAFLHSLTSENLSTSNIEAFNKWINLLKNFKVYFSWPLDLDFSLLRAFPNSYQHLENGMRGPQNLNYPETIEKALVAVLKENGNHSLYSPESKILFQWYSYLFLGRGKPITHMRILSKLSSEDIKNSAPRELKDLINKVKELIEEE